MAPLPIPSALTLSQTLSLHDRFTPLVTRILQSLPTSTDTSALLRRQATIVAVPTTYANRDNSPQPGVVAGIVLGTVGGVCIVLWLLYTIFSVGRGPNNDEVEVIRRRSRSPRRSQRRSETRSEVIEVSRSRARTPPQRERRQQREIIVEEVRRTSVPPPVEREDDIVEVIEEHSPPPRERRGSRRVSGYRNVDPNEFGGGRRPMRHV